MEGAIPSPRGRRRTIVAVSVVLAIVLVTAGYIVWLGWFRPYTIRELDNMMAQCPTYGDLCRLEPGTTITLAGTVARLRIVNMSLGPHTGVWLDAGSLPLMFPGDVRSRFTVGASVSLPLAIQTFRYNGFEFRGADVYPYPGLPMTFPFIIAAVSQASGLLLEPAGGGPDAIHLRIAAHRGEAFPLYLFRLYLVDVQGSLYVGESGHLGGPPRNVVEEWTLTENGTSPQGWLSFRDVAGNGLLDIGDEITVRGSRTASPVDFDSRLLLVNDMSGILAGVYYWYETSLGLMSYTDFGASTDFWGQTAQGGVAWGPESFTTGPPETVDRFRVIAAAGSDPISEWRYRLTDESGGVSLQGSTAVGQFLASGTMTGAIEDLDGDGAFSAGDRLEIRGGVPRTMYRFALSTPIGAAVSMTWQSGFGVVTGRFPFVTFSNETRLNATSIEAEARVAGGFPSEEARNFSLRVREAGVQVLVLDPASGTSASGSGITLTYVRGGDPALFDAGDRLRLEGLRPGLAYSVDILHVPRSGTSGTWTFTN